MNRPRALTVALLCAAAFLGALAVARAGVGTDSRALPKPEPLAGTSSTEQIAPLGRAAPLPRVQKRKRKAAPQPAAVHVVRRAAPAPKAAPAPRPAPAPAPAPAPRPAPKPKVPPGTPFFNVH